jgi:hypothetical protein
MKFGEIERPPTTGLIDTCIHLNETVINLSLKVPEPFHGVVNKKKLEINLDGYDSDNKKCNGPIPECDTIEQSIPLKEGEATFNIKIRGMVNKEEIEYDQQDCPVECCQDVTHPLVKILCYGGKELLEFLFTLLGKVCVDIDPQSPEFGTGDTLSDWLAGHTLDEGDFVDLEFSSTCFVEKKAGCDKSYFWQSKQCDTQKVKLFTDKSKSKFTEELEENEELTTRISVDTLTEKASGNQIETKLLCTLFDQMKECLYDEEGKVKEGKEDKLEDALNDALNPGGLTLAKYVILVGTGQSDKVMEDVAEKIIESICD